MSMLPEKCCADALLSRKGKRRVVTILLAVTVAAALLALVYRPWALGRRPNVIIILVDTLRQDYLSLYGSPYPTSPFIDSLGRRGTVFKRVAAQSSSTAPSLASFLTSMYPSRHGVWAPAMRLSGNLTTLTEMVHGSGYRTGYFSAHWGFKEKSNYGQGAEHFEVVDDGVREPGPPKTKDDRPLFVRAERVNEAVFKWLRKRDRRPMFLFIHYMDVHVDYDPPSPYREMFAKNDSISLPPKEEHLLFYTSIARAQQQLAVEERDVEHLRNLYRGEIAYVDSQIEALVEELKRDKLYRNSWIIIWADHGEEFCEHKGFSHGRTLYGEVVRVPLVIVEPGSLKRHRVIDSPLELIDVAPTLCDVLGFKIPSQFQGRSFAAVFRNEGYVERGSCYGEVIPLLTAHKLRMLAGDKYKIICRSPKDGGPVERVELYDTMADPRELHDLSESPESQQTLASLLAVVESIGCDAAEQERAAPILDEGLRRRLRAIGYL